MFPYPTSVCFEILGASFCSKSSHKPTHYNSCLATVASVLSPSVGSVTSIRSQPVGTCSSLRVPRELLQVTAVSSHHDSCDTWKIPSPQSTSRSPSLNRLLCRQVGGDELSSPIRLFLSFFFLPPLHHLSRSLFF